MPVTNIAIDCATLIVTITGTGFTVGDAIELQDPNGYAVDFILLSLTPTQIVLQIQFTTTGVYCVRVTSGLPPPLNFIPVGSFLFNGTD